MASVALPATTAVVRRLREILNDVRRTTRVRCGILYRTYISTGSCSKQVLKLTF
jgi:hypothetical protein